MNIKKGDTFRLRPVTMKIAGEQGPQTPLMTGRVMYVNEQHSYAVLNFGAFRESFSFFGPGGLYASMGRHES